MSGINRHRSVCDGISVARAVLVREPAAIVTAPIDPTLIGRFFIRQDQPIDYPQISFVLC
jgi:hypothetical protein